MHESPTEAQVERLLRAHRPRPDRAWVDATEQRLFSARRARRFALPRIAAPLRIATGVAGGLAALVLAVVLAGGDLLGSSAPDARAKDECRTVAVMRFERVPSVTARKSGGLRITYTRQSVRRLKQICD